MDPALAVVRVHEPNLEGFTKKGARVAERFDYLCAPRELRSWIEPLRKLASGAEEVHAVSDNCARNDAVSIAKDLAAILAENSARRDADHGEQRAPSSKSDSDRSE